MVPIALILLAIVILFSVAVVVSNPVAVDLSIFGARIPLQTPAVYFTGAGAMLVLIAALLLLRTGVRRSMARRKEVRTLKKEVKARDSAGSPVQVADRGHRSDASAVTPESTRATSGSSKADVGAAPTAAAGTGRSGGARTGSTTGRSDQRSGDEASEAGSGADAGSPGQASSTAEQREAWLAEIDDVTREDPKR